MKADSFSTDIAEFITLLSEYKVRYVIVGGEAVIYYGHVRLTGDIDFFYEAENSNANKLYNALNKFWGGSIPGISSPDDFTIYGNIIQFGVTPNRIDLINKISGIEFKDAWASKIEDSIEINNKHYPLYFISLQLLIKNKEAVRRNKDLDDLDFLKEVNKKFS
jgi:predicted nucleotidyltransferase